MGNKNSHREPEIDTASLSDEGFTETLKLQLQRLILYSQGSGALQLEVAEKLANEAVKPERQVQIVELGGLQLLLPLTRSTNVEIQRLAAHALANLSVNAANQASPCVVCPRCVQLLCRSWSPPHTRLAR